MPKKLGELGKQGDLLYTVKSDSTDEIYEIRTIEGSVNNSCTCIGYLTSKCRPKQCRHIRIYFTTQILKSVANDLSNHFDESFWVEKAKEIERLFKKES